MFHCKPKPSAEPPVHVWPCAITHPDAGHPKPNRLMDCAPVESYIVAPASTSGVKFTIWTCSAATIATEPAIAKANIVDLLCGCLGQ